MNPPWDALLVLHGRDQLEFDLPTLSIGHFLVKKDPTVEESSPAAFLEVAFAAELIHTMLDWLIGHDV